MAWEAELAAAREAAAAGGAIALERYRRDPAARRKADGTWVTEADEAVERELRRRLGEAFPGHAILGEEEGLAGPEGVPTWVVDPIDGTNNYLAGIPVWGVLVALRVDGESVVGVAHAPALGETYDAALGGGARLNGEPISVSPRDGLAGSTLLLGGASWFVRAGLEGWLEALAGRAARDRGLGDFWGHLLVARGAAHAMVEAAPLSLWDVAALEPIVAEAGGLLAGPEGEPWEPGRPCVTSASEPLQREIAALYGERRRRRDSNPRWRHSSP